MGLFCSQPVAIERAPQEPQVNEDRADVDVAEVDIEEVSPLDEEPKVEEEVSQIIFCFYFVSTSLLLPLLHS